MILELGQTVITRGIAALIEDNQERNIELQKTIVERYIKGDWGDTCEEDKQLNDSALQNGDDRIVAKYILSFATVFIITEWDRSYTTVLLPSEY